MKLCIKCGKPIEQWIQGKFTHITGKLCVYCTFKAFGDLICNLNLAPETPEEVDAELRAVGLDPEKIGRECAELAQRLLAEHKPKGE